MHHYEYVAPDVETSISRVDNSEPRQLLRSGRGLLISGTAGSHHPRSTGASRWSPVLQGEAVKICLASDSSHIRAIRFSEYWRIYAAL